MFKVMCMEFIAFIIIIIVGSCSSIQLEKAPSALVAAIQRLLPDVKLSDYLHRYKYKKVHIAIISIFIPVIIRVKVGKTWPS